MSRSIDHAAQARAEFRRLWGVSEPGRPGPSPGRSARDIARVGMVLADEAGLGGVTMRAVAERLGVSAMSLYNQVPGKAELLEVMLDEASAETAEGLAQAMASLPWPSRARTVARANWDSFLRHPWMLQLEAYRPVLGPGVMLKYDLELAAFEGLGLTDPEMDQALGSLLGLVRGCAATAIDADASLRRGDVDDMEWWNARRSHLEALGLEKRYPLATRVGAAVGEQEKAPSSPAASLAFGLEAWIAGVERRLGHASD